MKKKILITGGAGYIGSVLCRLLLKEGYSVVVFDRLSFGSASVKDLEQEDNFRLIEGDIRNESEIKPALEDIDSVVHLAAIVGDPACKKFSEEANEINWEASVGLYEACVQLGIGQFIFASTCSNYGVMDDPNMLLNEDAKLSPQSHYAKLKVRFEQFLLERKNDSISKSILRFATVYGYSPRLRFDLTVNHFTRDLTLGKPLLIFGKEQWRPYCHVQDLARSVVAVLGGNPAEMKGKVFNVGNSNENWTKEEIVLEILKIVPNSKVKYQENGNGDARNYKVDFSKIAKELGFKTTMKVPDGIYEIHKLISAGEPKDPFDPNYQNCPDDSTK